MLDPAILTALDPPMPPEVPRIAEGPLWRSSGHEAAEREATRLADDYTRSVEAWLRRIATLQVGFGQVTPDLTDTAALAAIGETISRVEAHAEWRAKWRSRFEKKSRRENKKLSATDPALAAIERPFIQRLLANDDRMIEGLLDHALFLRAVRSEWNPEARGGHVFDDPHELGRYLRAAVAV